MTDTLTKERRSVIMAAVRSSDTEPELTIRRMLHAAGLRGEVAGSWPLRLEFDSWVARMRTPPDQVTAMRAAIARAPHDVRAALAIQPDYSFTVEVALIVGREQA